MKMDDDWGSIIIKEPKPEKPARSPDPKPGNTGALDHALDTDDDPDFDQLDNPDWW